MFDSGMRLAKVVRVYPEGHSVDLVMYDDNSPCSNVQVMSGSASSRSGFSGLIAPTAPPDGEWGNADSGDEDQIAVVAFMRGEPIVLGFLFPQVNQMTFGDKNRMTFRHPSDLYVTTDEAGNFELSHPGGAYVRIAATKEHEDLSGKDFDGKWQRNRNSAARVHIHVEQAGGVAAVDIDPDGNIDVTHVGNLTTDTGGNMTSHVARNLSAHVGGTTSVTSDGDATLKAPSVTLDTPLTTCTGDLTVNGLLTYNGGMAGSGGGDSTASIVGNVNVVGDIHATGKIIDEGGNTNHHEP